MDILRTFSVNFVARKSGHVIFLTNLMSDFGLLITLPHINLQLHLLREPQASQDIGLPGDVGPPGFAHLISVSYFIFSFFLYFYFLLYYLPASEKILDY